MIKDKWLDYAIAIIKACQSGSGSISNISDDINKPQSYVAKVVASLRAAKIINGDYGLIMPASDITIRKLVEVSGSYQATSPVLDKVNELMLQALEISIKEVW